MKIEYINNICLFSQPCNNLNNGGLQFGNYTLEMLNAGMKYKVFGK